MTNTDKSEFNLWRLCLAMGPVFMAVFIVPAAGVAWAASGDGLRETGVALHRRDCCMGRRRERWPASTGFHVAFLMAFPVVVERVRSSVHPGPNPQGSILPPSERGCRLGRHPRSFFLPQHRLSTWNDDGGVAA